MNQLVVCLLLFCPCQAVWRTCWHVPGSPRTPDQPGRAVSCGQSDLSLLHCPAALTEELSKRSCHMSYGQVWCLALVAGSGVGQWAHTGPMSWGRVAWAQRGWVRTVQYKYLISSYGVLIMYTERWCRSNTVKVRGTVQQTSNRNPTYVHEDMLTRC
jgi:hypothetical protein